MIEVQNVSKRYGSVEALRNVTLKAPQNGVLGLLGQNGAGKTTLLNIITGYLAPTSGRALIDGNDPLLKQVKGRGIPAHVREIMQKTGLMEMRERLLGHLSKGYRQRVGLAQALCGDPDVLVLDEPTVGLDPKQITEIRALIRRLSAGRTIVFSSHNLAEVRQLCDRVVILHHGEVKLDAAIGDVGENDTVTLLCTVQGSEKRLVASMSHLDGVRAVNVQPGSGEDEVSLSLLFDKTAMPEKQVFTLCSAMSAPILRLARCEDDLEQVFLKAISD